MPKRFTSWLLALLLLLLLGIVVWMFNAIQVIQDKAPALKGKSQFLNQ